MSSLFGGGGSSPPPAPVPTPPPPMPDPQSPDAVAARNKAMAGALASGGRDSTVLTTSKSRPTLAGGGYGSKVVGG